MNRTKRMVASVVLALTSVAAYAEIGISYGVGHMSFDGGYLNRFPERDSDIITVQMGQNPDGNGDADSLAIEWRPIEQLALSVERLSASGLSVGAVRDGVCPPGVVCIDSPWREEYSYAIDLTGMAYGVQSQIPIFDSVELIGRISQINWDGPTAAAGMDDHERVVDVGINWSPHDILGLQLIYRTGEQFDDTFFSSVRIRF